MAIISIEKLGRAAGGPCSRCGGSMMGIRIIGEWGSCESEACISCGNVEDEIIRANRTEAGRARAKKETDEGES